MDHPIVLGYDGSTCSAAALDEAVALAHDLKATARSSSCTATSRRPD